MTIQTPDDETASFKIAEQKIDNLLKRLHDKRVCPCCTARALTYHGASMAEHTWARRSHRNLEATTTPAPGQRPGTQPCRQRKRMSPDYRGLAGRSETALSLYPRPFHAQILFWATLIFGSRPRFWRENARIPEI